MTSYIIPRKEIYVMCNGEPYTPTPERAKELIQNAVRWAESRTHCASFRTDLSAKVE